MIKRLITLLCLLSIATPAMAADPIERVQGDGDDNGYVDDGKRWTEDVVKAPALPKDDDLAKVDIAVPRGMTAYLGKGSISVSGRDGVTRYWLIITSPGGAYNATYEGLECATLSYRVLGYGSKRRNKVVAAKGTRWRSVDNDPYGAMHSQLAEYYLCAPGVARTRETVLDVLRGHGAGAYELGNDL